MAENGVRTTALEERFRARGVELERRISTLETQMRVIAVIGGAALTGIVTLIVLVAVGVLL